MRSSKEKAKEEAAEIRERLKRLKEEFGQRKGGFEDVKREVDRLRNK